MALRLSNSNQGQTFLKVQVVTLFIKMLDTISLLNADLSASCHFCLLVAANCNRTRGNPSFRFRAISALKLLPPLSLSDSLHLISNWRSKLDQLAPLSGVINVFRWLVDLGESSYFIFCARFSFSSSSIISFLFFTIRLTRMTDSGLGSRSSKTTAFIIDTCHYVVWRLALSG